MLNIKLASILMENGNTEEASEIFQRLKDSSTDSKWISSLLQDFDQKM